MFRRWCCECIAVLFCHIDHLSCFSVVVVLPRVWTFRGVTFVHTALSVLAGQGLAPSVPFPVPAQCLQNCS